MPLQISIKVSQDNKKMIPPITVTHSWTNLNPEWSEEVAKKNKRNSPKLKYFQESWQNQSYKKINNWELTRNTANKGNGANSSPVIAAIVPSEKVVTMANARAAAGELRTAGNCKAVKMPADIKAATASNRVCSNCYVNKKKMIIF